MTSETETIEVEEEAVEPQPDNVCTNQKGVNAVGEPVLCGQPKNVGASQCGDCHAKQRYTTGPRTNTPANPHLDDLRTQPHRK